jgi:hypothetical protein
MTKVRLGKVLKTILKFNFLPRMTMFLSRSQKTALFLFQAPDIGAELTGGCYGFATRYMHWPEQLIVGGTTKNKTGHINRYNLIYLSVNFMVTTTTYKLEAFTLCLFFPNELSSETCFPGLGCEPKIVLFFHLFFSRFSTEPSINGPCPFFLAPKLECLSLASLFSLV